MNDGYCNCGTLRTLASNPTSLIQQWVCGNRQCPLYNRVVYKPYNNTNIFQTYTEAEQSIQPLPKAVKRGR